MVDPSPCQARIDATISPSAFAMIFQKISDRVCYLVTGTRAMAWRQRGGEGEEGEEERERERERKKKKKGHSRRTISVGLNEKIRALLWKGEGNK